MNSATLPPGLIGLLPRLARLIHDAHIHADAHARATHERFNVFTTLLDETDEVRLHTRFLCDLLNPKGSHDCGDLFLRLFFATLQESGGLDHLSKPVSLRFPPAGPDWSVGKEQSRPPHGQIDLLLSLPDFGLAIENKIDAREQPRQLAAYAEYLHKSYGASWQLIYLTKDGKPSGTHENYSYVRISYREHILAWLEKCLRETYHIIPINQALQQYREVVRFITGKTLDAPAMKAMTDFIFKNPDILKYRQQILDGINEARALYLDQLADGVASELNKQGFKVRFRENHTGGRFGLDRYGDMILFPPSAALANAPFTFCLEHDGDLQRLLIGITNYHERDRPAPQDSNLFKKMDALVVADSQARSYHKAKGNNGWPTGWHDIMVTDDAALAELFRTPLADTVDQICKAVLHHVELIERIYCEAKQPGIIPN